MTLGVTIRRALGPTLAFHAGCLYRAIYVDLEKMAIELAEIIPRFAHLLDVGGGDGQPLNHLLALRPDLRVTTIDPAPVLGQWLKVQYQNQVTCLARTSLDDYTAGTYSNPDVILVADVLHHVPLTARNDFVNSIGRILRRMPHVKIILKDVEPGYWRATLGSWSDRYITGDKNVSLISSDSATKLFEGGLGPLRRHDTNLFKIDRPNYAIVLEK